MNITNSIFGAAIGDAMGVPYEFRSRGTFKCTDMTGFGTWNKPVGTYSDDTAMTLCTLDAISKGYSKKLLIENFIKWYQHGFWSLDNHTFDIGNTTSAALECHRQKKTVRNDERTNGNGSLMRVVPLAFWLMNFNKAERKRLIAEISSITHPHEFSINACIFIVDVAINLINGHSIRNAINNYNHEVLTYDYLSKLKEYDIKSDGFVLNTLQASLWVMVKTNNFKSAILKAVNLGSDTDTTACVVGGLAGIIYDIPEKWIEKLRGKEEIIKLIEKQNHPFVPQ